MWPLSRLVTVTLVPTCEEPGWRTGAVTVAEPAGQRRYDARPVSGRRRAGAGTAMVMDGAGLAARGRADQEAGGVVGGGAATAVDGVGRGGRACGARRRAGDADASPPGATAATVGGRSSALRLALPSGGYGNAATVRQDATTRRTRSPCSNLSFDPPWPSARRRVRDATATRRAARSQGGKLGGR